MQEALTRSDAGAPAPMSPADGGPPPRLVPVSLSLARAPPSHPSALQPLPRSLLFLKVQVSCGSRCAI